MLGGLPAPSSRWRQRSPETHPYPWKGKGLESRSSVVAKTGGAGNSLPDPAMNLGGCGQTPKGSGTVTAKERGEEANLDPSEENPETTGRSLGSGSAPGLS